MIANFKIEKLAFDRLIAPDSREKILLLEGESGVGKTTLLAHCLESCPENLPAIPIQLRTTAVTIAEVFFRSGKHLTWSALPDFSAQVADLQGKNRVNISSNFLAGINNHINVALSSDDPLDREYRRAALTDAWFDDLDRLPTPLLVALDAYEHAATEVREWIEGPFLSRVAQARKIRALVAGQSVPDNNNIEWGRACIKFSLLGVPEAKDWLPVVESLGRMIPVENPASWLAGVCHALKGRPKDIMQVVETLPWKDKGR